MKKNNKKIAAIKRAMDQYIRQKSFFPFPLYSNWYVGITNDPKVRKSQHKSNNKKEPKHWKEWNAASLENAREIETFFHDKGCQDTNLQGGAKDTSIYVYIYWKG